MPSLMNLSNNTPAMNRPSVKRVILSMDELLETLRPYERYFSFTEQGLVGVVEHFLSMDRKVYDAYYYGNTAKDMDWATYCVEEVLQDILNQHDALAYNNALPSEAMLIDSHALTLVLCCIAEHIHDFYQQHFGAAQYLVNGIEKLSSVGDFMVEIEPL